MMQLEAPSMCSKKWNAGVLAAALSIRVHLITIDAQGVIASFCLYDEPSTVRYFQTLHKRPMRRVRLGEILFEQPNQLKKLVRVLANRKVPK